MKCHQFLLLFCLATSGLAGPSGTVVEPWSSDLAAAQARAKVDRKLTLIHFSGSDWCGWCIKLRKEVFAKPEFQAYASSNLVLVTIDFPKHKPLPAATQAANQRVADQFQVQGFPTLVLLDAQGQRIGNVNYAQGGAKVFLAEIEKMAHPPRELPVTKPGSPRASPGHRAGKEKRDGEVPAEALTLKKITGSPSRRQVVINDRTLVTGETASVRVASGRVRVRCLEIREASVVVTVGGQKERRELRLSGGT